MVEPDRIFTFRVTWVDDKGEVQTNLGYRVQFNNAIGPYKGGIRFHASVNLSILKVPRFRTDIQKCTDHAAYGWWEKVVPISLRAVRVMLKSCVSASLYVELWRHLGPDMDVPAGDIGVGGREVGYMFGMYKKLTREFTGIHRQGIRIRRPLIRPEATGFGGLYFVNQMLQAKVLT